MTCQIPRSPQFHVHDFIYLAFILHIRIYFELILSGEFALLKVIVEYGSFLSLLSVPPRGLHKARPLAQGTQCVDTQSVFADNWKTNTDSEKNSVSTKNTEGKNQMAETCPCAQAQESCGKPGKRAWQENKSSDIKENFPLPLSSCCRLLFFPSLPPHPLGGASCQGCCLMGSWAACAPS